MFYLTKEVSCRIPVVFVVQMFLDDKKNMFKIVKKKLG
jgi:hypothetical protein